jgi:hypothetical protein
VWCEEVVVEMSFLEQTACSQLLWWVVAVVRALTGMDDIGVVLHYHSIRRVEYWAKCVVVFCISCKAPSVHHSAYYTCQGGRSPLLADMNHSGRLFYAAGTGRVPS